jgi:ChaB protein
MARLPGTLKRSSQEARETFLRALDDAARAHGPGEQARRIAYAVLKRDFEKRGDHWIAKRDPVDHDGTEKSISLPPPREEPRGYGY